MSIQGITVTRDQDLERVTIPTQYALDDQLISVFLINQILRRPYSRFRRLHDDRVTHFPRFGQGVHRAVLLEKVRHIQQTMVGPSW
jgi:hypothetical protein